MAKIDTLLMTQTAYKPIPLGAAQQQQQAFLLSN